MKALLKGITKVEKEVRALWSLMPLRDAWKLAWPQPAGTEMRIHLNRVRRDVVIRAGTSDLECLKKIFLLDEYSIPFNVSPKFIVDAGANIGMATLYFATRFPEARVIAIEPEGSNFNLLQRNCAGLPNVTLMHAALWPADQTVCITNPEAEKWSFKVADAAAQASSAQTVPGVSVPKLLEMAPNGRIDWLKLDIEGAELELFSSDAEAWLNKVGIITVELHDPVRDGCSKAFYSAILKRRFKQVSKGETVIVKLEDGD